MTTVLLLSLCFTAMLTKRMRDSYQVQILEYISSIPILILSCRVLKSTYTRHSCIPTLHAICAWTVLRNIVGDKCARHQPQHDSMWECILVLQFVSMPPTHVYDWALYYASVLLLVSCQSRKCMSAMHRSRVTIDSL